MTRVLNLSDVVLIRSASYDKNFVCGIAQTPPPARACPACARAHRTRVSDRDLQALRPTQLSLRRRAWPRAQAIFVDDRPNRRTSTARLCRSNKDWHRLLELCAVTKTLVFEGDGCYAPSDFNDSLLLGMKGTFAQAELHIIRARLHGGKLNKAQKGELRFPLPVGLVFDGDKIVLDPDQEVQGAVRAVKVPLI